VEIRRQLDLIGPVAVSKLTFHFYKIYVPVPSLNSTRARTGPSESPYVTGNFVWLGLYSLSASDIAWEFRMANWTAWATDIGHRLSIAQSRLISGGQEVQAFTLLSQRT